MASTSARLLTLLALLGARPIWPGRELAERLGVSTRSLRRDLDSLRDLGYDVRSVKGPDGGYRLGPANTLPPLLLDDEQALAIAVALQTAPTSVSGIEESVARALTSLRQIMPAHLRAEVDAMHLTTLRNYWEFPAPPVRAETLRAVGHAVRNAHLLSVDHLAPDGRRPHPSDPDFVPPVRVEPHHLVVWAGRWYLVGYTPTTETWGIHRVDRLHVRAPTGIGFARRELPGSGVAHYVTTSYDRGDTTAQWPCVGTVVMELPAEVVAPWVPGGSVVEHLSGTQSLFTVGAWSWAGVAGLLGTFDADFTVVGPPELSEACRVLTDRCARACTPPPPR